MKRRIALVAALCALSSGAATAAAAADPLAGAPRTDTNGCVVVKAAELAVCIPRL